VRSITSSTFWRLYRGLPEEARAQAKKNYLLWMENPFHPSLHFKTLQGEGALCSVRVGQKYRAVGVRQGDAVRWVWIGTHNEFDKHF
jgi:hypothetical protein